MATRLKTVQFAFPALASLTNNTLTNLTQITVYLPESSKTFRSVVAQVTFDDIITATGGTLTTKTLDLRLGAAAYTSVANANTLTNSGENISFWLAADYTSHFTTNWSGTSMTCDFRLQINQSTGTTLNMVNVCCILEITYEYDDTSATQVKTAFIPLDMTVGAMDTAATTRDTIPALDTHLPERDKTYRNIHVVVQGNEHRAGTTTDHTLTLRVGTANVTTGNYEGSLASDRFFRYVWELTSAWPSTAATQTWQPTATVARCNHCQAYLAVTYEFSNGGPVTTAWAASTATSVGDKVYGTNASGLSIAFICTTAGTTGGTQPTWNTDAADTTVDGTVTWTVLTVRNSVILPLEIASPLGGTASTDHQRATRELFIQEPGPIADQRLAFYGFWTQTDLIAGLNLRVGTGSFVTYTDTAAVLCGSNAVMIRNDSGATLARGRNEFNVDAYRTDTSDFGWNLSGFFIASYLSPQHRLGHGAHNHTVMWGLQQNGTAAVAATYIISATAPAIPETSYYISALGTRTIMQTATTSPPNGVVVQVERLSGEGGPQWEDAYADIAQSDAEVGIQTSYSQIRDLFLRWPGDPGADRMDLETARRWRIFSPNATGTAGNMWPAFSLIFTYHTISSTVSGNVTNSAGGTVNLKLHRDGTGERVLSTTRSGNGSFSFTWWDNTENVYVDAYESGTHSHRSDAGLATYD